MTNAIFPDLDGASVFITGGGSGIGAALTDGFLGQGAKVAFVQRSDASAFVAEMEAKHGRAPLFLRCDITDVAALRAAVDHAADAHGPVLHLINNAANDQRHASLDVDEAYWDRMQAINLKAYFFAAQAVLPGMQAAGRGAIVNFSSISYMMGMAGMTGYTTANGGITAMTRSLAREFGPDGVRINALAPGWVMTDKQRELWVTPEALAAMLDKQCLKREIQPEDIVGPVLFLSSDAGAMMTGQVMVVDGGVVVTG
ncbi:SDR family NAD(P)-dependent oxidoreductase [Thalassococcus sp. BH17M4-6]|uniref:SDR family NAD(P)-dependent oxidoreductase n=1 Tax=Thalassococcus sp. BH17M4-6 TaxID=3413148 RepID=UPI003BE5941A